MAVTTVEGIGSTRTKIHPVQVWNHLQCITIIKSGKISSLTDIVKLLNLIVSKKFSDGQIFRTHCSQTFWKYNFGNYIIFHLLNSETMLSFLSFM